MIVRHRGVGVGQGLLVFGGRSATETATASIFEMVRERMRCASRNVRFQVKELRAACDTF